MKPIDRDEFIAGVQWWQTQTRWPNDFHNADYEVLAAQNPGGAFLDDWWASFVQRLTSWLALRPLSRVEVTASFVANRDDLIEAWHQSCSVVQDKDIADVNWHQVQQFPAVVARLKPTTSGSPVFPSKFCHFLLPRIFPVFDNLAVGGSLSYGTYFNLIKDLWQTTPVELRTDLIAELSELIESGGGRPMYAGFPQATKITELALIGRRRARHRRAVH